eukprot:2762577-Rhodomonas_salina.1
MDRDKDRYRETETDTETETETDRDTRTGSSWGRCWWRSASAPAPGTSQTTAHGPQNTSQNRIAAPKTSHKTAWRLTRNPKPVTKNYKNNSN